MKSMYYACELCGEATDELIQPDRPGHKLCQSIRSAYIRGGFHQEVQAVRDHIEDIENPEQP